MIIIDLYNDCIGADRNGLEGRDTPSNLPCRLRNRHDNVADCGTKSLPEAYPHGDRLDNNL